MTADADGLRKALGPLVDLVVATPAAGRDELVARTERVVAAAVTVLQVDAVGLVLLDEHDRLRVAAASDEQAALVELEQLACHEGPSIDAARTGSAVRMDDLQTEGRYPTVAERLATTPVRAVLSTPVVVDDGVVGSLTASLSRPHEWSDAQVRAAASYADVIGLVLRVNAHAGEADDEQQRLRRQLDLTTRTDPDTEEPTS